MKTKKRGMKAVLSTFLMAMMSVSCNAGEPENENQDNDRIDGTDKKMLVVYYSWSGNTRTIAQYIQEATGADIFEVELTDPFSTDYNTVAQEYREDNRTGTNRKLKNKVENLSDYDIIFLGAPIWGGTRALPVKSFLLEHDLSDKTVAPFTTHGGGGAGSCFNDMKREAPKAKFLEGLALAGSQADNSKNTVERWLNSIGVLKSNN